MYFIILYVLERHLLLYRTTTGIPDTLCRVTQQNWLTDLSDDPSDGGRLLHPG